MDHQQIEDKLTEAYDEGVSASRGWMKLVEQTLEETKGIGPGRKALFLERLKFKVAAGQNAKKLQ